MPTKTFSDFIQIGTENDELLATDYLVGYRTSSSGVSYETRITSKDFMSTIDDLTEKSSINASKILFSPQGANALPTDLNSKLNQFKSTEDFIPSPTSILDSTAAGTASTNNRLFVGAGTEIKITVPSQFPSISEALNAISKWHIERGAIVKIIVTQDLEVSGSISLNHPYGQNIQILGAYNGVEGAMVSLRILTSLLELNFNLFECSQGHHFGLINNFYLEGRAPSTKGEWGTNIYSAVLASHGSFINLGSNLKIKNWYHGVKAMYGSVINADGIIINEIINNDLSAQGGAAGLYAYAGSQISAKNSISNLNFVKNSSTLGIGYKAECSSQIDCELSLARYNKIGGYISYSNSQINAKGSTASNTTDGSGFVAREMGEIDSSNFSETETTSSNNNTDYGFLSLTGGTVHVTTFNGSGNSKGLFNKSATTGISGANNLKAGIVSNDTTLRFDTTLIDRVATQLEVVDSDGANRITIKGATNGEAPELSVDGSDLVTDLVIKPKQNGRVIVGDLVNSNIQFGTFTANTSELTSIGYITIYDKNGVARKLLVVQT